MPIYEYACMSCEQHFEELVRGEEQVSCPDCGGSEVLRQFSVFAAPSKGDGGGGSRCGGCSGGSCSSCGH
ncbi:MAG: FmdB family zinc ribbon protein [Gaiellaceae bacterium]